ncbi:putative inactive ATP-dependent zinc metalloprotease FTSHI 5, chloroplastic [Drosera capensis]
MQFILTTNGALTIPSSLPHFTTPPPHRNRLKTLKSRLPISRFPSHTLKIPLKVRALCYLKVPVSSNPSIPRKKGFFGYPFGSIEGKKGDEGSGEGRVLEGFTVGGGIGNNGVFDWCVLRSVVLVVICVVIGSVPVRGFQAPAAALPSITGFVWRKKKEKAETRVPNHEYSEYTKSLLDEVSGVLKMIDEVRGSKREVCDVEDALKEVKWKSEELQAEIVSGMYRKQRKLYLERESLVSALDVASYQFSEAKSEWDVLLDQLKFGHVEDKQAREMMESRVENLEATLDGLMTKSDQLSEKIADVEQQIERTELKALSIGVRELASIEQECEHLVSDFVQDMRRKPSMRLEENPAARLSRDDIQKDLEAAQKEYLKQAILPSLVEVDDPGLPLEGVETDFAMRIKHALDESRELQRRLEGDVRKKMKKFGDEKRIVVKTPDEEVVKGYPEAELKWMFGSKEIVVPKAVRIFLYHGWKKWREEAKADLKKELLQNVDLGREYMMRRQERIILDRDRIVSRTVYDKEKNRWEMDPIAVPFAVSKKLVEYARIRQDWAEMFVGLKGDDREYRVDIKEYDILFEDFGGFDTLYLKMVASGIPTFVQVMWIPFSELNLYSFWKFEKQHGFETRGKSRFWIPWLLLTAYILFVVHQLFPGMIRNFPRLGFKLKNIEPVFRSANLRKLGRLEWYINFRTQGIMYLWIKERNIRVSEDPVTTIFNKMKRVKNPPIPLSKFVSLGKISEEVDEVVMFLKNPGAFQKVGARAPRGILIIGADGTGKRSLALAIAAEARVPMVEIKPQELESSVHVGQSAANVRELFQTARDLAPVILFVENFDAFAGARGKFVDIKNQEHENFINQLLVELDGYVPRSLIYRPSCRFEKQEGVLLMATVSDKGLGKIDPALLRPGRMDRTFQLGPPKPIEREMILRTAARDNMDPEFAEFVDWKKALRPGALMAYGRALWSSNRSLVPSSSWLRLGGPMAYVREVEKKTRLLPARNLDTVPMVLEANALRRKIADIDELICYTSWFSTLGGAIPTWLRMSKLGRWMSSMLINHLGLTLEKEDLQYVIDHMDPYGERVSGIELVTPLTDWTRETKLPYAVWAAGRGLTALLLPNFDIVEYIWLEPKNWKGMGFTKITETNEEALFPGKVETKAYNEKKLVLCFGSFVAMQMLLPPEDENVLSRMELKQAQEISLNMVIEYGWGPDDGPSIYWHSDATKGHDLKVQLENESELAARVQKLFDMAYDKALEMLHKNRVVLEKIVDELLDLEGLSGKDLEIILEKNGGVREVEPFGLSKVHKDEAVYIDFLERDGPSGNKLSGAPA